MEWTLNQSIIVLRSFLHLILKAICASCSEEVISAFEYVIVVGILWMTGGIIGRTVITLVAMESYLVVPDICMVYLESQRT